MQDELISAEILRKECWSNAFDTYGKEYIFNKRALKYSRYNNLIKMFGIIIPAMLGTTVLSYKYDEHQQIIDLVVSVATVIMVIQFFFSVWAIMYKWDDELSYSYEAAQDYSVLSDNFKKLGQIPPNQYSDLKSQFDLQSNNYRNRELQDAKHNVKEWELRRGMRWALREFQKECVDCAIKPTSMESSDCPVCGNFSFKHRLKNQ